MLTREEILVIYEAGPEAVISVIQRLESIIEEQSIRTAELEERVNILESRLNQNSETAVDLLLLIFLSREKPNPKSLRKKSGKKPGGQDGHPGTTLDMVNNPD